MIVLNGFVFLHTSKPVQHTRSSESSSKSGIKENEEEEVQAKKFQD